MTPVVEHAKRKGFDGLARHLIVALILFSSMVTALITAVELYSDYRRNLADIDKNIDFIRQSYLPILVESVWLADSLQINTQLEGLSRLQDFEYFAISVEGKERWSAGTPRSNRRVVSDVPMVRSYRGKSVTIGTLHIVASVDRVLDRLWAQLLATLLRNLARTLLLAVFMLYLFQRLAGRHLEDITQHMHLLGADPDAERTLQLDRPERGRWRPDVLDEVVRAVNSMHRNIHTSHAQILANNETLEAHVLERTTELSKTMLEAERANAAKSEFLSRMSHELRTPLNAILGFGQLLESDPEHPLTEIQADNVHEILHGGKHLLELVNEVLDLSRIESGRLEISLEPIAVAPLVEACVAQIKPLAAQRAIAIALQLNTQCAVQADYTRLKQVLLNLLSNAVKYNRKGGSIRVSCAASGERLRISVQDSGPGIAAESLARLFRPFERLESSYDGIEGTGIGLALAKKLVEAMHGEIGVDSRLGEGSTFWFELPISTLAPAAAKALPTLAPAPAPATAGGKRKLLYVEDNPANLRLVQKILATRHDIELLVAASGEAGLEIAAHEQLDLILLDINLPGMDGFEVLRILKDEMRTRAVPVIAVTANAMRRDVERGKAAGFADYLTKPLDLSKLLDLIDQTLQDRTEAKP